MIEKKLIKYIEGLDHDIIRLRDTDENYGIRNLVNESDANLLEDIKFDLLEILKYENKNKY